MKLYIRSKKILPGGVCCCDDIITFVIEYDKMFFFKVTEENQKTNVVSNLLSYCMQAASVKQSNSYDMPHCQGLS